jgi:hypothetical protein
MKVILLTVIGATEPEIQPFDAIAGRFEVTSGSIFMMEPI